VPFISLSMSLCDADRIISICITPPKVAKASKEGNIASLTFSHTNFANVNEPTPWVVQAADKIRLLHLLKPKFIQLEDHLHVQICKANTFTLALKNLILCISRQAGRVKTQCKI